MAYPIFKPTKKDRKDYFGFFGTGCAGKSIGDFAGIGVKKALKYVPINIINDEIYTIPNNINISIISI